MYLHLFDLSIELLYDLSIANLKKECERIANFDLDKLVSSAGIISAFGRCPKFHERAFLESSLSVILSASNKCINISRLEQRLIVFALHRLPTMTAVCAHN